MTELFRIGKHLFYNLILSFSYNWKYPFIIKYFVYRGIINFLDILELNASLITYSSVTMKRFIGYTSIDLEKLFIRDKRARLII